MPSMPSMRLAEVKLIWTKIRVNLAKYFSALKYESSPLKLQILTVLEVDSYAFDED